MIDFNQSVVERSRRIPVVVDFWADWCGPCRVLGPIIESLARDAHGRWELVKVDTEEQPELAQAYDVRGIPSVKMFYDGGVIAEFTGALPADEVRRWLEANLPDRRLKRLAEIVSRWGSAETVPDLERLVEAHPDLSAARLRLAQAVAGRDPARARRLVEQTDAGADLAELATDVTSLIELMEYGGEIPEKIVAHVEGARSALAAGDLGGVLEHLVDLAMRDRKFGNELARRASISLFHLLGPDHDLTREHRRRLSMALHA